jgi:hypothetical protein
MQLTTSWNNTEKTDITTKFKVPIPEMDWGVNGEHGPTGTWLAQGRTWSVCQAHCRAVPAGSSA